jgi:adenylosuccinate lyase
VNLAGLIEKIALDIRLLSRSEVMEVSEAFGSKQKGSSAMPHKRNPIQSENLMGLARLMRGYLSAVNENGALWHERDISHSSVERIVFMDATTLLDTMLTKVTNKKKYQYWALELNPLKFAKSEKLERIAPPKVTFNLFLTVF